jgi:hypothetical protein
MFGDRKSAIPRSFKAGVFRRSLGLFLLVAIAAIAGCQLSSERRVPPYLLGKWETDAPRYKGLNFEITNNYLIFTTAAGTLNTFSIAGFDRSVQGDTIQTVFYGQQNDMEVNVAVFYEPANGGQLRLKNHLDIVWRRVAET